MKETALLTRRQFHSRAVAAMAAASFGGTLAGRSSAAEVKPTQDFKLRYIVASCMYGMSKVSEILPEVPKTGAEYIEIWALRHGNQREQIDEMGPEAFAGLLKKYNVKLGSFTCFKFGIFNMQGEMALVKKLGGDLVICNSGGPKGLEGDALKSQVRQFAEKLKPHVEAAERIGVTVGVENHSGSLINSPDTQRMLLDAIPSKHLGIALAPYHLTQDEALIAKLIEDLGDRLVHFQAWEHGMGCHVKLPKEQEVMQLPGRGTLDFTPILGALKRINYQGRTEIFMHPVPRGILIRDTIEAVTDEINLARRYLEKCLKQA